MAYEASEWSDLFVAAAGASAALAGLLFVAVSINVERILQYRGLPERALEALALLLGVLVISIIGLIPGQDHVALGIELLLTGLAAGGAILVFTQRQSAERSGEDDPEDDVLVVRDAVLGREVVGHRTDHPAEEGRGQ